MDTVYEDELGEAAPITHALFLPMDEALPRAPFLVVGQLGLPDAVTLTASSSSMTEPRTVTSAWRRRRSVARIRYGKKTVKVICLDDTRAGFSRRRSPAPGHSSHRTKQKSSTTSLEYHAHSWDHRKRQRHGREEY